MKATSEGQPRPDNVMGPVDALRIHRARQEKGLDWAIAHVRFAEQQLDKAKAQRGRLAADLELTIRIIEQYDTDGMASPEYVPDDGPAPTGWLATDSDWENEN